MPMLMFVEMKREGTLFHVIVFRTLNIFMYVYTGLYVVAILEYTTTFQIYSITILLLKKKF